MDGRERPNARPSTTCFDRFQKKTWMPATSAGMTELFEHPARLFLHRHITHLRAGRLGGELAQDRKRIGRGVQLAGFLHDLPAVAVECGLIDGLAAKTRDHAFAVL